MNVTSAPLQAIKGDSWGVYDQVILSPFVLGEINGSIFDQKTDDHVQFKPVMFDGSHDRAASTILDSCRFE